MRVFVVVFAVIALLDGSLGWALFWIWLAIILGD